MASLRLSPEEGFVLSRLDAPLSVKDLVDLTGIEESRVVAIVETLATQGAVELDREVAAMPSGRPSPVAERRDDAARDDAAREAEEAAREAESSEDDEDLEAPETPEQTEERAASTREYQRIYETVYHPMERDARIAAAKTVDGGDLLALCLDADPQVIHAVLTNPKAGLQHARMIAQHHRTHIGLDHVGRRNELISDRQVQRRLLVNPQLPDVLLRKIVGPKRLGDVYKIAVDREIPERSRVLTREALQKKFMVSSPDERAALLIKTEGRCLVVLVNCALDSRTTQLLTAKTTYTVLFIQNLARWTATPPVLLTHLLKQPLVRQNVGLRKMVLQHRNVPAETKRNLS
jgi:hypothetical protein